MANDSEVPVSRRNVSTLGLLVVAFFWCSGGIYGNEVLLQAAPAGYVLLTLLLGSVLYALPISVISAELACAAPYDGGLVAWVEEACGPRLGAHNLLWLWVSYLFDACSYPVLAVEYFANRVDMTDDDKAIAADGIILVITLIKLGGTDLIVRASGALFVVSLLPTTMFCLYGAATRMRPHEWLDTDTSDDAGGLHPAMLLSWMLWLYRGFVSLGALAGETKTPEKTYPVVIGIMVPFVTFFVNILPVMVSVSVDSDRRNYTAGHFDHLATELVGDWLGVMFTIGSFCCFVGLYNAQMIVCERSTAAFLSDAAAGVADRWGGCLLSYLCRVRGTGVAPVFIIFNAALASVIVWLPYDALIELSILALCIVTVVFMWAYVWYRVKMPELKRPFKMPGGVAGGLVAAVPVCLVMGTTVYFSAVSRDEVLGIKDAKIIGLVIIVLFGVVVDVACSALRRARARFGRSGFVKLPASGGGGKRGRWRGSTSPDAALLGARLIAHDEDSLPPPATTATTTNNAAYGSLDRDSVDNDSSEDSHSSRPMTP